jgi:hypothetical protein
VNQAATEIVDEVVNVAMNDALGVQGSPVEAEVAAFGAHAADDDRADLAVAAVAVGTELAPEVETIEPTEILPSRVDLVARAALDRAEHRDRDRTEHTGPDRDRAEHGDRDRKGRRDKRSEPTTETREFWETWADEKSARVAETRDDSPRSKAPAAETAAEPAAEAANHAADDAAGSETAETAASPERSGRSRDRDRDKPRGREARPDRHAKPDRPVKADRHAKADDKSDRHDKSDRPAKADDKADRPAKSDDKADRGRGKRDTVVTPAAAGDGAQSRLFVSLGKKHGVSADDLRTLLAGPIGGDTSRIGSVSLRDSHAHVRVPEECVDAIIAGVHGTQHREQDVTVERARG